MKNPLIIFLCVLIALASFHTTTRSKGTTDRHADHNIIELPHIPAALTGIDGTLYQTAAANTTVLGWWQFDDPIAGECDPEGWTTKDATAQLKTYFHVDGDDALDDGCHTITPVNGQKSMWCGQWVTTQEPWCGWSTLPGVGNSWDQRLVSDTLACDTLSWSWTVEWDSEPYYDFTYAEYLDTDGDIWIELPVNSGAGHYDGVGGPSIENFEIAPPNGWTRLRYRFTSDGAWSDEDGLWPTAEGAVKLDDITVVCQNGPSYFHDFESEACGDTQTLDGFWRGETAPAFGDYARLVHGSSVVQEDPCFIVRSCIWVFFDDPLITNYACGGWPLQGAMPYRDWDEELFMDNEIWSPWIPNAGSGTEYILSFLTYRDLPLDNLQFYTWYVRAKGLEGCPSAWDNPNFVYYGGQKDWLRTHFQAGSYIAADATDIQVAIAAVDMCKYWCGIYHFSGCHSHAPLFDQVRLVRVDTQGPQWVVRHIELWQDNFPDEGDVDTPTSFARCDMAMDMLSTNSGGILPGDSLVVTVADPGGLADDNSAGRPGKAVYVFVRVTDRHGNPKPGKSGTAIESPDNQAYAGDPSAGTPRWPWVGTVTANGQMWDQFKMDYVYSPAGGLVADKYCCDLMDIGSGPTGPHYNHTNENTLANTGVFTPGDVINYFFGAMNASGQWTYWHRTYHGQGQSRQTHNMGEAALEPCEWSVLPDAGLLVGELGDILFVDDADDRVVTDDRRVRGGPPQVYFDWVFDELGIADRVDRFDVLGPSSVVDNSLASRVKNYHNQLIGDPGEIYQQILWNSSNLAWGLVGDGGYYLGGSGSDKSPDWSALKYFMDFHPNNPGCFLAGDNMADDWMRLNHPDAIGFKGTYMNFNLVRDDHKTLGEPVSPLIRAGVGGSYGVFDQPEHLPNGYLQFYAYGGCAILNDFDVLQATGSSRAEMTFPVGYDAAVLAQATITAQTTARAILTGFGFDFIRDDGDFPHSGRRTSFMRDMLVWFNNIIP
ncbi:MAG: hypothetical protein JSW50_05975, partial [Candidatus Latescibacterota bacterium]